MTRPDISLKIWSTKSTNDWCIQCKGKTPSPNLQLYSHKGNLPFLSPGQTSPSLPYSMLWDWSGHSLPICLLSLGFLHDPASRGSHWESQKIINLDACLHAVYVLPTFSSPHSGDYTLLSADAEMIIEPVILISQIFLCSPQFPKTLPFLCEWSLYFIICPLCIW